ncbi:N-acetylglucosamine-6-phosphate deacetylase [Guptibacillus sedimenti]|uniref:N-acetylglucosamine-6-phosphate deacetylase n=1 Tax=Guptibacillus sedimenti TaxID=3025680 RepID=UPI002360872D|nr:N-acetylglucosamine-6-phosphate deacetylase [Pseudalkalibacillus sedimenti]
MYYLKGDIITNGNIIPNQLIEITEGMITRIGGVRQGNAPIKEVKNGYICPGFIDIHIHGVDGMDFMDEGEDVFKNIANHLPKYGVTSYLATSRTASLSDINDFLHSAKQHASSRLQGSRMIGVHLEGPWISPQYNGAQSKILISQLTWEEVKTIIEPYQTIISKITLAPEELEDQSIIRHLVTLGIQVSAGHTNANMDQIETAIEHGLSQLTHTFNAMSPVHHRNPGTAAAAFYFDTLICELITDGVHVDSRMIDLLYKLKSKENISLISDCTGYNLLTNGEFSLRGKELVRKENEVRLKNGRLAGSAITLNEGVKHATDHCGISLEDAVYMATQVPMKACGSNRKLGQIKAGYFADFVILDQGLEVIETIIDGKVLYSRSL